MVKQNKDDVLICWSKPADCSVHYSKSDMGGEMLPSVLHYVGKFTEYFSCAGKTSIH
jgi:hypothetical protein